MWERIEQLDGSLVVDSTPGVGTRVVAELPVRGTAAPPAGSVPAARGLS